MKKQHKFFFASVTTVYLFFFVIGRVLTRLELGCLGKLDLNGIKTMFLSPPGSYVAPAEGTNVA